MAPSKPEKYYEIKLTAENIKYLHKLLTRDKKAEYIGRYYGPRDEQLKQLMLDDFNESQRLSIARATMTKEFIKDNPPLEVTAIEEKKS